MLEGTFDFILILCLILFILEHETFFFLANFLQALSNLCTC